MHVIEETRYAVAVDNPMNENGKTRVLARFEWIDHAKAFALLMRDQYMPVHRIAVRLSMNGETDWNVSLFEMKGTHLSSFSSS